MNSIPWSQFNPHWLGDKRPTARRQELKGDPELTKKRRKAELLREPKFDYWGDAK